MFRKGGSMSKTKSFGQILREQAARVTETQRRQAKQMAEMSRKYDVTNPPTLKILPLFADYQGLVDRTTDEDEINLIYAIRAADMMIHTEAIYDLPTAMAVATIWEHMIDVPHGLWKDDFADKYGVLVITLFEVVREYIGIVTELWSERIEKIRSQMTYDPDDIY